MFGLTVFIVLLMLGSKDGFDSPLVTNVILFGILYYTKEIRDEVAR